MRLQFVSDLHLEMYSKQPDFSEFITPVADNLALLGDIGNPFDLVYEAFLSWCSSRFKQVVVLAGNHELYSHLERSYFVCLKQIENVCSKFENVQFLEDTLATIDGVRVFGCTLWSNITNDVSLSLNDYRLIYRNKIGGRIDADHTRVWHRTSVGQITDLLEEDDESPVLLLTHHGPLEEMNGKYQGNVLSSAFATDLSHLFKKPLVGWLSGHTHQSVKTEHNGILSQSNCFGYPNEKVKFSKECVFEFGV